MAKSSKSEKSERQKLIDEALKKQRSAEKRSGFLIVGVCIVIALGLVGAAAFRPIKDWWDLRQYQKIDLASIGAPASVCEKVVKRTASGVSEHVPEGTEVTYDYAPPAYGAHWNVAGVAPAPFADKLYDKDDRPALEALVHNLEHGYTILWYDETIADDAGQMTQIRAIAKKFKADDDNFRLKFIAAPWLDSDKDSVKPGETFPKGMHVALTHWRADSIDSSDSTKDQSTGLWQYCSEVSGTALKDFMDDYPYTDSPEPGAM